MRARLLLVLLATLGPLSTLAPAARADCPGAVASVAPRLWRAALKTAEPPALLRAAEPPSLLGAAEPPSLLRAAEPPGVELLFLGHASFQITTPGGLNAVTDFNGYHTPPVRPDLVTMNLAHSTHYTDRVEGIGQVLRGWREDGGPAHHDVTLRDLRVRNIATNIREMPGPGGSTRVYGNSIFVFETADLCIAHLSHLHHLLSADDRAELGQVDVLLAPIDGIWTMSQEDMIEVVRQVRPAITVPMHYIGKATLDRFLALAGPGYPVRYVGSRVRLSRPELPERPEILVMPERF